MIHERIENAMKNQAEYVPAKKECILPFLWQLCRKLSEAVVPERFGNRAIGIGGDMAGAITDIRREIS